MENKSELIKRIGALEEQIRLGKDVNEKLRERFGRILRQNVGTSYVIGTRDFPLTWEEIAAKVGELIGALSERSLDSKIKMLENENFRLASERK